MRNKIVLVIALLIMLADFSSCRMRDPSGAGFHYWNNSSKTKNHWGAKASSNGRQRYWGKHRYGPRPYKNRGHFRTMHSF